MLWTEGLVVNKCQTLRLKKQQSGKIWLLHFDLTLTVSVTLKTWLDVAQWGALKSLAIYPVPVRNRKYTNPGQI